MILQLAAEPKKVSRVPIRQKEPQPFLREEGATPATIEPPTTVGAGRRILVVDDNLVVLKAFEAKLKNNGFEVATVSNANLVASSANSLQAELIILDINFPTSSGPDWTGFTILQWLRRFPELGGIPVIMITGEQTGQYKEKALAAGAVGFFQKPVPFPELLAEMLRLVPRPA